VQFLSCFLVHNMLTSCIVNLRNKQSLYWLGCILSIVLTKKNKKTQMMGTVKWQISRHVCRKTMKKTDEFGKQRLDKNRKMNRCSLN
jgi:hypothetical protein